MRTKKLTDELKEKTSKVVETIEEKVVPVIEEIPIVEEAKELKEDIKVEKEKVKEDVIKAKTEIKKPVAKKEKAPEGKKETPVALNSMSLGNSSKSLKNAPKTVEISKEDAYKKLRAPYDEAIKNKEIMWGQVVSVIYDIDQKTKKRKGVGVICDWNRKEVIIPDGLYFPDERLFGSGYNRLNDEEKIVLRHKIASYQIGAIVCFVITSISISKKRIGLVGDRVTALNKIQDFYFTHENFKETPENTLKVGSIAMARVLAVRPHNVVVECCGVQTFIDANVLANVPVENCRDIVSVGDTIEVRIRKVYPKDKYITVTGKTFVPENHISEEDVGSIQLAYMIRKNSKDVYTFRLNNGATVMVQKSNLANIPNFEKLKEGDEIILKITDVSKEGIFYFGRGIARR